MIVNVKTQLFVYWTSQDTGNMIQQYHKLMNETFIRSFIFDPYPDMSKASM
jgi:hypothetical protein